MATKRKPITIEDSGDVLTAPGERAERVLTVNGKPIPDHLKHAVMFAVTDQGIAEAREKNKDAPRPYTEVVRDAYDKKLDAYGAEAWDAKDPLKEVADRHKRPGFAQRLLSKLICDKKGLRGWSPVKDERGDAVTFGNMFLGEMPQARADKRNEYYRALSDERMHDEAANFAEIQAKGARDSGMGVTALRENEVLQGSGAPGTGIPIGISRTRGA